MTVAVLSLFCISCYQVEDAGYEINDNKQIESPEEQVYEDILISKYERNQSGGGRASSAPCL